MIGYRTVLGAMAALSVVGCTDTAMLVPQNQQAASIGSPKMTFSRGLGDSGDVTITMPSGEVLTGRYSITSGEFGSLAYGMAGRIPYSGSALGIGNRTATAIASDGKLNASCDVQVSLHGHGAGVCDIEPGAAQYRVVF